MTNTLPYQTNNAEFNPLFVKMQARFSVDNKTIAQAMLERAEKYEADSRRTVPAEVHMTKANFLPQKTAEVKSHHFFSMQTLTSFCLIVLVLGTLLFSGALINKMAFAPENAPVSPARTASEASLYTVLEEPVVAKSMILPDGGTMRL